MDPITANFTIFYNGNPVAGATTFTNFPSHTLTLSFGCKNGNASDCTMSVDHVLVAKDRLSLIA
jgi:hypothetical protein